MEGRLVISEHTDPFLNLAVEHAIIKYQQEFAKILSVRLWYNSKCVTLGRMQNVGEEVNVDYCQDKDIEIVRRISGGGAVYQDLGNLNISFYGPLNLFSPNNDVIDASGRLTSLICLVLKDLGYDHLSISKGSNIMHKTKKISGSANYLSKNWFLHHLTLLHDANLLNLRNSLLARDPDSSDRQRSKYSPTVNLPDFVFSSFRDNLKKLFASEFSYELVDSKLSPAENELATELVADLYSKKDWIYDGKRKN